MKYLFSLSLLLCFTSAFAQEINIELVANGFSSPLEIKHAGDDRLFVVEQPGRIKILYPDTGDVLATPFLNITSKVTSGGERGLLGLAFHPDYDNNGYFYVYYTNTSGNTQISRFSVDDSDPDIADPNSELQMLSFNQPFGNHNGGHIAFGPDGMLYIASGDGGSGGDPQDNGQSLSTLLGKLLRLDVDAPAPYTPTDNPFVDDGNAMDEIWAYGLRNSWKFSFDSETDDLWIADVGQNSMEEINREPSTAAGLNYGWRCYEGTEPYNTAGCPDDSELTFPLAVYSHSNGCSITGGYVYRGSEFPNLQGLYFFSDACSAIIGTVNATGDLTIHGDFSTSSVVSFGVDNNDNLYLAAFGSGGAIYKIVDDAPASVSEANRLSPAVFPNPATDHLTIQVQETALQQIALYNSIGQQVFTTATNGAQSYTVNVSELPQGIYFVEMQTTNGKTHYKKIVVE